MCRVDEKLWNSNDSWMQLRDSSSRCRYHAQVSKLFCDIHWNSLWTRPMRSNRKDDKESLRVCYLLLGRWQDQVNDENLECSMGYERIRMDVRVSVHSYNASIGWARKVCKLLMKALTPRHYSRPTSYDSQDYALHPPPVPVSVRFLRSATKALTNALNLFKLSSGRPLHSFLTSEEFLGDSRRGGDVAPGRKWERRCHNTSVLLVWTSSHGPKCPIGERDPEDVSGCSEVRLVTRKGRARDFPRAPPTPAGARVVTNSIGRRLGTHSDGANRPGG